MTPRWKIRRAKDGMWAVQKRYSLVDDDGEVLTYYATVAAYRHWENAIVYTQIVGA